MGREVRARIEQLREKMAERGMDAYLIPTSDFHGSEYVSGQYSWTTTPAFRAWLMFIRILAPFLPEIS